jgi:hypothetical protein
MHDIPHSVLHIDKGFFFTLRSLALRPGKMLEEYVDGKRVDHFRPFAFVIIMTTVCAVLINLMRTRMDTALVPGFFSKYPSALIFILIPVISLVTWLCFHDRRFNYWEHVLFNTYLGAFLNVFLLMLTLIRFISFELGWSVSVMATAMVIMFCFMTYYGFVFGAMMHGPGRFAGNLLRISIMDGSIATIYFFSFVYTGIIAFS